jgi:nucleotide-binding universal stress UspA family protein
MFHRPLLAFDGSPHAQRALAEAIDLAQTNNGSLTVMTLAPEPSAWTLGGGFDVPINLSDLNQQIRQEYETMLDAAIATVTRRPPRHHDPEARSRRAGDRR